MRQPWVLLLKGVLSCLLLVLLHPQQASGINPQEVRAYLQDDQQHGVVLGANLFIGSSSIRRWTTLAADMAPMTVVRRGFNHATLPGIAQVQEIMVYRYAPTRVILFAGANDLFSTPPASAQQVFHHFRDFAEALAQRLPRSCLFFIAITPTPARMDVWPAARAVNQLVSDYARHHQQVVFIKTEHVFLDENAIPIPEYYAEDGIHLSERGYSLWTQLVKRAFEDCP